MNRIGSTTITETVIRIEVGVCCVARAATFGAGSYRGGQGVCLVDVGVQQVLQRPQLLVGHVQQRILVGVPLADRGEDGHGGQDRRAHRQHDLAEHGQGAGAVHLGRLLQRLRNGLDEGLDQDDVERLHNRREHVDPEVVRQVQVLHRDEHRDQAGVEVHRDDHEAVPELTVPHPLLSEHEAEVGAGDDGQGRADHGTGHRHEGCGAQALELEDLRIVLQVEAHREPVHVAGGAGVVIGDRVDDEVVERVHAHEREHDEEEDVEDVEHLLTGGPAIQRRHFLRSEGFTSHG